MWRHTSLTKKLNIELPIVQAPMAGGATTPELIAAVSNAGGLGSLGAGYMPPPEIKTAIQKIRQLTSRPFAVNLFIPTIPPTPTTYQLTQACHTIEQACQELQIKIIPPAMLSVPIFEEQLNVIIEEKVSIFSFIFGIPAAPYLSLLKKYPITLIGTATTMEEACFLENHGVDIIVAQGSEAGGHRGTFLSEVEQGLIPSSQLIPQLRNSIKVPIIAAGGMMNGEGIATAFSLGAAGVQIGTAFLTCAEAGIPEIYKENLLSPQNQRNTVLTRAFSGKFARSIRNKFTERMISQQEHILDYPLQHILTTPMRQEAKKQNNADFLSLYAGEGVGLSRKTTATELINALVNETDNFILPEILS